MEPIVLVFRKTVPHFFSIEKVFSGVAERLGTRVPIKKIFLPYLTTSITNLLKNLLYVRKQKGAVYHVTGDVHYAVLALPGPKTILTIHDCIFLHQYSGWKKWFFHRLLLKWPVRHSKVITTISEKSRKEIIEYSGCSPEKVRVIPNPVSELIYCQPRPVNTAKPILLFLGSTPNKNLKRTVEAIRGLNCRLNIIGIIPQDEEQLLVEYGIDYAVRSKLSEQELADAYAGCDVVLFPSLYEGFGLVIIEGQKAGRPVITSNLSPMREVAGNGACLVDPLDIQAIRNGLDRILNEKDYASSLIAEGFRNVKRFEVENIAAEYLALYNEMKIKR